MKKLIVIAVLLVAVITLTTPLAQAGEQEALTLLTKITITPRLPAYAPTQEFRLKKDMARTLIREWAWSRAHNFNIHVESPGRIEKEILAEAISELYRYLPRFMELMRVPSSNPGLRALDELYIESGGVTY